MKIAVCDDDINSLRVLKRFIERKNGIYSADYYNSIEMFWDAAVYERNYDAVLMDIDWNGRQRGIEFANRLMKENINTQIIYVTGYNDKFSQEIFLTPSNLCGYLVKPVDEKKLNAMLELAEKAINKIHIQKLVIRKRSGIYAISYSDILWLSSELHKIVVHCNENEYSYNGSLSDLKEALPENFAECHKSFWVNMNYIKHINNAEAELLNGAIIPVSRSKYRAFTENYMRYIGKKIKGTNEVRQNV
ncbi:MAG: LytTR family DNA-binding domain-containing protein [Butyrivibrio sp.]|nr:LytTR family DNA-binding domain-containing protein [Butyrivibrio sp.]